MDDRKEVFMEYTPEYSTGRKPGRVEKPIRTAIVVTAVAIIALIAGGLLGYFSGMSNNDPSMLMGAKTSDLNHNERKELEELKKRYGEIELVRKQLISMYYKDVDESKFSEAMIRGMLKSLDDPYTVFFNEKEYKEFNDMSHGSYGGLGITISPGKDGFITVISTFKDSPANKAGIKKDDKILKVEGVEYGADKMDLAVGKMRGEPGTEVNVTIGRGTEQIELKLKRALIIIESVEFEMMDKATGIGYIRINSFDDKVAKEFKEAYNTLLGEGMKGFVLDLRDNPGGSLSQCVEIADTMLGDQVILNIVEKNKKPNPILSDATKIDRPYVVLVNSSSASASEILAGAIQDTKSAPLIGTTTFGKGLVQTIWPIFGTSGLKVTTSEYTTTNGRNIHGKGITPDIVLELSKNFKAEDRSTDNQLAKALEELKKLMK